jgi:gliding motility-associated lipoprotein GldD
MNSRFSVILLVFFLSACNGNYTPKPAGYPRVVYPEKAYTLFDADAPFSFEYPVYARMVPYRSNSEPYWYNMEFPALNGEIHLSYKPVDGNLNDYIEDSRSLVYKHAARSDGINELPMIDTLHKRYGILYDLKGNVASAVQFFVTDSAEHFLRGSLYFNTTPNRDSLNPVIAFVREDIVHLIKTLEWK